VTIHYVEQKDIDYSLWDRCIHQSLNGEIYVFSWFLDAIAGTWDALVENDYKTVMPLVYTRRLIYRVIYRHPLLKHLGIFSGNPVKSDKIMVFLENIPVKFQKIDIPFNRQNTQAMKGSCSACGNVYEMDLIVPYNKKVRSYTDKIKRAIDVAHKMKLSVVKHTSLFELEFLLRKSSQKISESMIITPLLRVLSRLISINKSEILGIYGPENRLYSAACFIRSGYNVVMLFAHTLPAGVQSGANYFLLDSFLKEYSGQNVTLSLEHVDATWNDEFYSSFGAIRSYQYRYCKNNIPFPLRWLV
jgi:hypothetical protein